MSFRLKILLIWKTKLFVFSQKYENQLKEMKEM